MTHPKLTVVVTVFNGEKYIDHCLNSLAPQLCEEVQVVIIDDGSTDATSAKVTNFLARNSSYDVLHLRIENSGVSNARNKGFRNSSGDYITFIDADDTVSSNYVQTILLATKNAPDIIEFGYRTLDADNNVIQDRNYIHTKFGKHEAKTLLPTVFSACNWYPWIRVINRDLLGTTPFPPDVNFCEDIIALSKVYKKAKTITTLNNVLYNYKTNPVGATSRRDTGDYILGVIEYYRSIIKDKSFSNKALKINLAYVIRRFAAVGTPILTQVPTDIEDDLKLVAFTPSLFLHIPMTFLLYALYGICFEKDTKLNHFFKFFKL